MTFSARSRTAEACSKLPRNGNGQLATRSFIGRLADQMRRDVEIELVGVLQRQHLELRLALALADAMAAIGPFGAVGQRHEAQRLEPAAAAFGIIFDIELAQRLVERRRPELSNAGRLARPVSI